MCVLFNPILPRKMTVTLHLDTKQFIQAFNCFSPNFKPKRRIVMVKKIRKKRHKN